METECHPFLARPRPSFLKACHPDTKVPFAWFRLTSSAHRILLMETIS